MRSAIITIGDELLIGQVINTNAAWIGDQLTSYGIDVERMVTVGDDAAVIRDTLELLLKDMSLVIITGGLGPTHDDVTKHAVAEHFKLKLRFEADIYDQVRERFAARGVAMPESNRSQAMVPEGFEVLRNELGTAPGLWYETEIERQKRTLVILPGVPFEMKGLMETQVLPRLQRQEGRRVIMQRTLLTAGIGESRLAEELQDVMGMLGPALRLAFLPEPGGVRLRLTALGADEAQVRDQLHSFAAEILSRIPRHVYGEGSESLEIVVGRLLKEMQFTIAIAESCTGGYLLNQLTNRPGSSAYVRGGIVAYSNQVKIDRLSVDPAVLEQEGAVSEAVAVQMASHVREEFGASIGVSTTGIAGPDGGTPDKPVGTVWVGYSDAEKTFALRLQLVRERLLNKEMAAKAALNLIRRELLLLEKEPVRSRGFFG